MNDIHKPLATSNWILGMLSSQDTAALGPHLEPVTLARRAVLETPRVSIEYVYFPTSGIASSVARATRDRFVEVGLFGRDGMSGFPVVMGNDRSAQDCFMQVGGDGMRIRSDRLRTAMDASATLRLALLRFVQSLLVQTSYTALANARAPLEERLCRWLLMCHDRVEGDTVDLTHEFLATMLGVRRAGVTTAVHTLESRGMIRAGRGSIEITDRKGIEECADGIYGVPEKEYERLVGVSIRGS